MPLYTWLRARKSDSRAKLREKKRVIGKLKELRSALNDYIDGQPTGDGSPVPTDSSRVLRLATWNIHEFDSRSYGERLAESKSYIAEILSHFDLIAVQEAREDLKALQEVMRLLGPNWGYLATDVTAGSAGNRERMVYVHNRDKVWFRDVAGELTLAQGKKITNPYGERFQIKNGPKIKLVAGQTLSSPVGLKTKTENGVKKLDQDLEVAIPEGTTLKLPSGS